MIGIATSRMVGINISRLRYLRKRIATSSYSTTLIADDDTDIIIGDASTDLQIRVVYYAVRGSLGQSGEMVVESPYNNYVVPEVQNDYFYDDVGITTLTPSINGDGRIVLTITVDDSSVDDVEFGYNLDVIKSVEKTELLSNVKYGRLYNWYAVDDVRGLAPSGYSVATYAEHDALFTYLGGLSASGGKLKSTRTDPDEHPRWDSPNTNAIDEYGFLCLPGGYRNNNGVYENLGKIARIYTSFNSWVSEFSYNSGAVTRTSYIKTHGHSIRMIRDNTTGWKEGEKIIDLDGNVYNTVKIGDQVWTVQNWACTKYTNGENIPNVTDAGAWEVLDSGAYCNYDNDESNVFFKI